MSRDQSPITHDERWAIRTGCASKTDNSHSDACRVLRALEECERERDTLRAWMQGSHWLKEVHERKRLEAERDGLKERVSALEKEVAALKHDIVMKAFRIKWGAE